MPWPAWGLKGVHHGGRPYTSSPGSTLDPNQACQRTASDARLPHPPKGHYYRGAPCTSSRWGSPPPHTCPESVCVRGSQPKRTGSGREERPVLPGVPPTGRVPAGSRAGSEMGPARAGRGGSPLGRDLGQPEGFRRTAGRARAAVIRSSPVFTSAPTSGPQPSALLARTSPWSPVSHHPVLSGLTPAPVPPTLRPPSRIALAPSGVRGQPRPSPGPGSRVWGPPGPTAQLLSRPARPSGQGADAPHSPGPGPPSGVTHGGVRPGAEGSDADLPRSRAVAP